VFYEPDKENHGLPFNPYKSIVVPRPIGWISTLSRDGVVNLAPYSQFNNLAYDPPYVMFTTNSPVSAAFFANMATYELRKAINITSQLLPPEIDEAALAGLEMIPCRIVGAPRVAASPVHLECRFHCALALPANAFDQVHHVVIGRVVGVHIRDDALTAAGKLDVVKIRPLARLGYFDYTTVDTVFSMAPSGPHPEARAAGLEGRPTRPARPL